MIDVRARIAKDHARVDGTETVTVRQPSGATFTVIHARRANRPTDWGDAGPALLPGSTVVFYFWTDVCSQEPKLGAKVTDSGGVGWRVMDVTLTTMRTRYDVVCVKDVVEG